MQDTIQNKKEASGNSQWTGDVVISEPHIFNDYTCDSSITKKSKANMTLDEYKQWFMNEFYKIPVSGYYRSSFVGTTIIKDEAFQKMKDDPEAERATLNMLREGYSVNGLPQKSYCYQVIGGSPEGTYGNTIPMGNGFKNSMAVASKKSWWQKRHEGIEASIEESKAVALLYENNMEEYMQTAKLKQQLFENI